MGTTEEVCRLKGLGDAIREVEEDNVDYYWEIALSIINAVKREETTKLPRMYEVRPYIDSKYGMVLLVRGKKERHQYFFEKGYFDKKSKPGNEAIRLFAEDIKTGFLNEVNEQLEKELQKHFEIVPPVHKLNKVTFWRKLWTTLTKFMVVIAIMEIGYF